jgi:diguanylate cyclase (GGDEF)-like protein/PAS domain S-box-containing protein
MPQKQAQGERERVNSHSGFETKVLVAFAAAVLVVAGMAAATWKVARDAADAVRWVTHTHSVIDGLSRIRGDTLQIEFSTQGFRLTGDPERLIERDETILQREAHLARIHRLLADNPVQMTRWQQLRAVLDERLALSRQVEQVRKAQGAQVANLYVTTLPLQETRQRTYRLLREMESDELRLLDERQSLYQEAREDMVFAGAGIAVLLTAMLGATYVLLRRQLRARENARQALAASEENLSITLHAIGDGVLVTDAQGCVTRINPVAEQLTGWSQDQALGRPITEVFNIVHEETRAPAEVPVQRVLDTGAVQGLANHTQLLARDGREYPIADSAAPIRNAAGEVIGVVLVFRDVSTERQAQRLTHQQNELLEQRVLERTEQLRESQDHLQRITSGVPALIAYIDTEQRYIYANRQYCQRFATRGEDIIGRTVREVVGEARYAVASPAIQRALQGEPQTFDWQPSPDIWQLSHYVPRRDSSGQVIGCYALGTDITEIKLHEARIQTLNTELARRILDLEHVSRALRTLSAGNRTMLRANSEQELLDTMCQTIVAAGGYGVAVVWYRSDDAGQSLLPAAESGYPGGLAMLRLLKTSWAENVHGRGAVGTAIRRGLSTVVADMRSDPNYAAWLPHLEGQTSGLACPLCVGEEVIGALAIYDTRPDTFDDDEITLLTELADDLAFGIGTLRERSEQLKIRQAMHHLTHHDPLTGLYNETQFTEMLTAAIEEGLRTDRQFAVLQTNIERLGEINDALGFSHGDQLLREYSVRLRQAVSEHATVVRLRGDEFAILLPDGHAAAAAALVQRLHEVLAHPFPIADLALDIATRIGVALFPEHGMNPHDLFRHMDMAVRQAKKQGKGHAFYDAHLNPNPSHRLTLAGELRRAIEEGDLTLYLQPKVDMASGRVHSAEGLVRWKHATRGLIPPGEFIELAEHTGLIRPLTEWVVETTCQLNQSWSRQGCQLPLAVNFSARNLHDEHLPDKIRQLQATWGLAPGLIEIEITESTVMDDAEFALRVLHGLREQGIPLYIDDFGTGYSSLSYLQKLPVDYIKIDQTFVRNMTSSKDSTLIVRSTIDLAHDMGRKVVAEGVETRQHWDQLAALGCDYAQGYFIARPMPSEAFQAWLRDYRPPARTASG